MPYTTCTVPPARRSPSRTANSPSQINPIIPFIRGDGTGPDIWAASVRVFDAAVEKAYGGAQKIAWMEVFAGETSKTKFDNWLPDDTVAAFQEFLVGIKGPLTTPVGGGIRSLNVALRQMLDLYVCLRPVQYFTGVPSPVKRPEAVDMVIFRENTEDIYAGIDFEAGGPKRRLGSSFSSTSFRRSSRRSASATGVAGAGRRRHQAGVEDGHAAAGARGDPVRDRPRTEDPSPLSTRATS